MKFKAFTIALAATLTSASLPTWAQTGAAPSATGSAPYPLSRVTLVTHSSPGGGTDLFLRSLSKQLAPLMKTSFAVENVRGGSGATAMAQVAAGKPDGSIFYGTTPTHIQTSLLSRPSVGWDALDPIAIVFLDPEVIYARTDSPHKSLADAVNFAKSNPGKARWGASNPASLERIAMERLARAGGVKVPIISHEGGGDQMIGVLNGTYDIGIGEVQELRAQLEAGKIKLLAVLTEKRLDGLPQLPTAKEQGLNVVVTKFRGIAGPKGISEDVAVAWEVALRRAIESSAFKAEYTKEDLIPVLMGRSEARKFTAQFARETADSLRELGVLK